MDRLLRAEEQFPPVEETCWGVRDVSRADKGCTREVDVIAGNRAKTETEHLYCNLIKTKAADIYWRKFRNTL